MEHHAKHVETNYEIKQRRVTDYLKLLVIVLLFVAVVLYIANMK
jgi:hypothetical protein